MSCDVTDCNTHRVVALHIRFLACGVGVWPAGGTVVVGDLDGDGRDGLFFYDAATGAWSRYLTGDSTQHDKVVLVEQSGTWSTGWSIVGRPE